MRIASRFDDRYKTEKCPVCLSISQNFMELSENTLGCLYCGCVFVPKFIRKGLDIKALLEAQSKELICEVCGKVCKSALGLTSHMRSHAKDGGESKDD